jgi:hypothetical protein
MRAASLTISHSDEWGVGLPKGSLTPDFLMVHR